METPVWCWHTYHKMPTMRSRNSATPALLNPIATKANKILSPLISSDSHIVSISTSARGVPTSTGYAIDQNMTEMTWDACG